MGKVSIEIDEARLKSLVIEFLSQKLGSLSFHPDDLVFEVKTSQNYKSEWEKGKFRVRVERSL